jgi:hydrophobic/amphiphilic exporter-1 (mainly G- bacteria), HAE1 family
MRLIEFSLKRRVTVSMIAVAMVIFGFVAYSRLQVNLLPDISYPTLTVETRYAGAAPNEIEALITRPIEEVVGIVSGVKRLTSTSRPGLSQVTLEFEWGRNMDFAALEVRQKLDLIALPREAEKPILLRFDPANEPVIRLYLSGGRDLYELRYVAEEVLKKDLESTEGIAAIKVNGGFEEEIEVRVDEGKLALLGIPIADVNQKLRRENINQAGGSLYEREARYLVRSRNEFRSLQDIMDTVLVVRDGRNVTMADVATVERGHKQRDVVTRFKGDEAVELSIYKEGDANIVAAARNLHGRLERVKKELPSGIELSVGADQSRFIRASIDQVLNNAILGGLIAILVLLFFLKDLRSTIIVGVSIPISVIATFFLMYRTGTTLNIMSLGGLALGVGMLVDNAIVVLESIFKKKEEGLGAFDAAYNGASEVGMAVIASTLTTIAVFLPVVFLEGIAAQLFRDQALTVSFALLASLAVSLTLIPMMAAFSRSGEGPKAGWSWARVESEEATGSRRILGFVFGPLIVGWRSSRENAPRRPEEAGPIGRLWFFVRFGLYWLVNLLWRPVSYLLQILAALLVLLLKGLRAGIVWTIRGAKYVSRPLAAVFDRALGSVAAAYPSLLRASLRSRGVVLGGVAVIFVLSLLMVPRLGLDLIPTFTQGEFLFRIQLPEGTPLETTDRFVASVQQTLAEEPLVRSWSSVVGGAGLSLSNTGTEGENAARIQVQMKPEASRADEEAVAGRIRGILEQSEAGRFEFERPSYFTFRTPIEIDVFGDNLEELHEASGVVLAAVQQVPGIVDIRNSSELGNPELQVAFDRDKLAQLDLDLSQVATTLRTKVQGETATRFTEGDREINIVVRSLEAGQASVADIGDVIVGHVGGRPIALNSVAEVTVTSGPSEIRRIAQKRAAVISGNLSGRDMGAVAGDIRAAIGQLPLGVGVTATLSGQEEEMQRSMRSLMMAMALAIFLVYLVMASQFESLLHPFIIIFTLPLAAIGAIGALAVTGRSISVVAVIGAVMLAGIVVNNAIVLIDAVNQLRKKGVPREMALVEAGSARLRPILMTSATTILGLLPMAIGFGEGAELRTPLAITVIGGLAVSTVLTLIVIPLVYSVVDRKRFAADLEHEGADIPHTTGALPHGAAEVV